MTTEELKAIAAKMKKEAEGNAPDRDEARRVYECAMEIIREREKESEQEAFPA